MQARRIDDGVHWVGAVDWDRKLFDDLIPLPDGTSYNSFVVQGSEKTALIDAVDPSMKNVLMERLRSMSLKSIDYVVVNHAEQDHSGVVPDVLAAHPMAKVLCTEKCKGLLADMVGVPDDRVITVKDGEEVSLGGKTLQFIHFPWVHWPETMLTWVPEVKTLFPCDLFGSHLASPDLYVMDEAQLTIAAKRYYAEIMMPFRGIIAKHLDRVTALKPRCIAPSHGPIHDRPELILESYRDWVMGPPKNLVVVPYISMHGSTRIMVEHFVEACAARGICAEQFDLSDSDIGKLAMSLVDAATIVLGCPTVLAGPHPKVAYAAILANALRPKVQNVSIIGSYGWGGKMVETLASLIPQLKVEVLPPVVVKGLPREKDLAALDALADEIRKRHGNLACEPGSRQ